MDVVENEVFLPIARVANLIFPQRPRERTPELHLPLPHALHLYGGEVWQVVVLIPQGVLLWAEGGQAPRSVSAGEDAVRAVCGEPKHNGHCEEHVMPTI